MPDENNADPDRPALDISRDILDREKQKAASTLKRLGLEAREPEPQRATWLKEIFRKVFGGKDG